MNNFNFLIKSALFVYLFLCAAWAEIVVKEVGHKEFLEDIGIWEIELAKIPESKMNAKTKTLPMLIRIMKETAQVKSLGRRPEVILWKAFDEKEMSNLAEGLMITSISIIEEKFLEVDALASAPWNLVKNKYEGAPHPPIQRVIGAKLMDEAFKLAQKDWHGIFIHPVEGAKKFYRDYFFGKESLGEFNEERANMTFTFKK